MPVQFAVTLFTSALLLFLVQPMVGKMVLPHLGGSPAVWNTCMVFFQALLLIGYWYAHKLTSWPSQRRQVAVHLAVLSGAAAVMLAAYLLSADGSAVPVLKSLAPRGSAFPFFWVIGMMAVAIGVPFFAVSTSAPLLQRWFTATGHPASKDPYFLYAASNAGSLISLLAYPILVEPNLRLAHQTWLFGVGFVLLLGLTFLCGRASMNPVRPPSAGGSSSAPPAPEPARWRKAKWVALAFVPSSLMLGITSKMTTDVASVPLLWIIPLTLYLLTFIIAFGKMPKWTRLVLANLTPVVTLLLVFVETSGVKLSDAGQAVLHVANFFLLSLLMHGELAHDRPDPKHLTNYFLWISFGGVLGGLFNSLLAPLVFTNLYEYHLAIVIGCVLLPAASSDIGQADAAAPKKTEPTPPADGTTPADPWFFSRVLDVVIPVAMIAVVGWLQWAGNRDSFGEVANWIADALTRVFAYCGLGTKVGGETVLQFAVYAPPCMLCFLFIDRPVRFGLCVLSVLVVFHYSVADYGREKNTYRSFHGIMHIYGQDENLYYEPLTGLTLSARDYRERQIKGHTVGSAVELTTRTHTLMHGTTTHGVQHLKNFTLPAIRDAVRPLGAASGWEALALLGAPLAWDQTKDPLTYYHRTGPVGDMFREAFRRTSVPRVGMVGLGTGSAAAYAVAGQKLTFYEIDRTVRDFIEKGDELHPAFVAELESDRRRLQREIKQHESRAESEKLAWKQEQLGVLDQLLAEPVGGILRKGGRLHEVLEAIRKSGAPVSALALERVASAATSFTYVTDARRRGAEVDIVMGDARLTLEEHRDRGDGKFNLLLIDAFSSDSIPTHLLTVEAVGLYRDLLAPNGLLALHVSNRYLRLEPIVQAIAEKHGMACRLFADDNDAPPGKSRSSWMVLARSEEELGAAFADPPVPLGSALRQGDRTDLEWQQGLAVATGMAWTPRPPEAKRVTWKPVLSHPRIPAWTDDFKDVLRVSVFPELQAVRRWVGLANPLPEWEAMMRKLDVE